MSAKEMFKKLGYKRTTNNKNEIEYIHKVIYGGDKYIYFNKQNKFIETFEYITLEELQAINKQVEELGWSDNNE
jgi:hypothetical protein